MNDLPAKDVEIFSAALELPLAERGPYLDRACEGDSELRNRVEALLREHGELGDFLEKPPPEGVKLSGAGTVGAKSGDRIGRYKLLKPLGEGGCGVVYLAEQEEPIHRQVALKIIKPGMDSRSVIARFEVERQALALMDHPHIAKVLDAGATKNGRPYFVMELVEGVKITQYCDQQALPTRARLELFIAVCDAIQHAHQKGIIHRDIKPPNILVTKGADAKTTPKVIDFGIAKAISGQQLTAKAIFTAQEMLIGTPAYMSPEQTALGSADVDTRTDIYSLGVLLYELLTHTTPFDTRELLKAGFDEVRRVIRDEEPVRPSTRLTTMTPADLASVSKQHGAEAPNLIREMRGELDWIVMKALEKDRGRRYQTANALAGDIQRYLKNETVSARPPSAMYQFQKLFLRNKLLFIGLGSIFLFLVVALAAVSGLVVVQRRALHVADALQLESAASEYVLEGKPDEAKATFAKSVAIRKEYLDNELPAPHAIRMMLENLPEGEGEKLFNRIGTPSLLARPEYSDLYAYRVEYLARSQRWDAAAHYATLMIKLRPNDSGSYHTLAPLLAVTTNLAAYRELCPKIVMTFSNTTDPLVADRMAKDCLILPSAGVNLKAVEAMAKVAVTAGPHSPLYPYLVCTEALAQYRLGNYSGAMHWAQVCSDAMHWVLASVKTGYPPEAQAYAVVAMAQYKLGNTNAAEQALSHCNQVMRDKLPQPGTDIGSWRDWILAQALQKEADALISRQTE